MTSVSLTAQLVDTADGQTIQLPHGVRLPGREVIVRRQGKSLILEPAGLSSWPEGFFSDIRVDDPMFERAPQGQSRLLIPSISPQRD